MNRPEKLYKLQRIDSKIDRHTDRLEEIERALADNRAIRAASEVAQETKVEFEKAQKALRSAEREVKDQRIKIEQSEARLYSGKITNPKELEDIQKEVAALKRYLDVLEERQLESMMALDDAQVKHDEAQEELSKAQAASEEKNSQLIEEREQIQAAITDLDARRQEQISGVLGEDLHNYENLRAQRGGVAVTKVENRACSACGVTLTAATYQQSRSPSQITHCDTCGRIVFAE